MSLALLDKNQRSNQRDILLFFTSRFLSYKLMAGNRLILGILQIKKVKKS